VPLIIERQDRGEIKIIPGENGELTLDADALLREIQSLLNETTFKRLRESTDAAGKLSLGAIKAGGLKAAFDERKVQFEVGVPAAVRRPMQTEVFRRTVQPEGPVLKPSLFSAFLNLRSGIDYVEKSGTGTQEGLQTPKFDFAGAINFRNWVGEGEVFYNADAAESWHRGDLRLVHDDPERLLRFSAGDLAYPVTSFQRFVPLGGLMLARDFALQPYRVTEPLGNTSFFLKSDSKVEVMVNGRLVQTLQLPAGAHNLRNFPFASGANDVTLRITDPVGRVETVNLSFFFDSKLLVRGETEFAYSVGLPSRRDDGNYQYASDSPTLSVFHRVGLTDKLTAGFNLQADRKVEVGGMETVFATPFGTFQGDYSASRSQSAGFGQAARLQYRYYDASADNPSGRILTLGVAYTARDFARVGIERPENPVAWEGSARYSQRLFYDLTASVGGSYQLRRDGPDTSSLGLFFSKRWRNVSGDLALERNILDHHRIENRLAVSLTFQFPSRRQILNTAYDSHAHVSRADWQYYPRYEIGGVNASAGVQHAPRNDDFVGGLRYAGYRGEASLSQDVTTPQPGMGVDSRTSLRLGTALVFADGEFAVSRPIQDSFALVKAEKSLAGQTVGVDPIDQQFRARADRFGDAVIPDLQSYQYRKITSDPQNVPVGRDPGQQSFTAMPSYKSGTVIRVGEEGTVALAGTLQTVDGQLIALQAGDLTEEGAADKTAATLFTNREGKFYVEGLKVGRYSLRLHADPSVVTQFEVPQDKYGLYEIGDLRLAGKVRLD